jgi:hypothetical protein
MKSVYCLTFFIGWFTSGVSFNSLMPLPAMRIVSNSLHLTTASDKHNVTNLVGRNLMTEYASKDTGRNTEVEVDFEMPFPVAAFCHMNSNGPAVVVTS